MMGKVFVKWYDAKFDPGPHKSDELANLKLSFFKLLGYLVMKDDTTTIIASEYSDDGDYRDITIIPTGSIVSVEELIVGV